MHHTIALEDRVVHYTLRTSSRARRMQLTMHAGGHLIATIPTRFDPLHVEPFMKMHSRWIMKALTRLERVPPRTQLPSGKREYKKAKIQARDFVKNRLAHFNQWYGAKIGNISIRDQKSRWGSCSRKGNLNFNFKIIHLPAHLSDYIIVHELCHILEMNHSKRFWALVAKTMPHHVSLRRALRAYSLR